MQDKLKEITERIYNEGISKSQIDGDAILQKARLEAEIIVQKAQVQAQAIIHEATKTAEETNRNLQAELKLAANQLIESLKQNIANLIVTKSIQPPIATLFNQTDFIKEIIIMLVNSYINTGETNLQLILPQSHQLQLSHLQENTVINLLNSGLTIQYSDKFSGGFKINFVDKNYLISFTDADFMNFFKTYLRPNTYRLLFDAP